MEASGLLPVAGLPRPTRDGDGVVIVEEWNDLDRGIQAGARTQQYEGRPVMTADESCRSRAVADRKRIAGLGDHSRRSDVHVQISNGEPTGLANVPPGLAGVAPETCDRYPALAADEREDDQPPDRTNQPRPPRGQQQRRGIRQPARCKPIMPALTVPVIQKFKSFAVTSARSITRIPRQR